MSSSQVDDSVIQQPHAFHLNLPPHHFDDDGVPYVTKFAHDKARRIVALAMSIQLDPKLFSDQQQQEEDDVEAMILEDDEEEEEEEVVVEAEEVVYRHHFALPETLQALAKKCARLHGQINTLESLKYRGMTQREVCDIVLHLLRLVSCSMERHEDGSVTLHYENVGYIYEKSGDEVEFEKLSSGQELEKDLERPFALHSTVREVLLLILVNLLSNKDLLRSVSNTSVYPNGEMEGRFLLVLHWKALLRMLLRTAPYLDERKPGVVRSDSNYRQNTTLKRTVQLIRDARHFYNQGVMGPKDDRTARELWEMVQVDVKYHSHTHACYRGTIMLYLFLPSRCTSAFYMEVLPQWLESWTNIDRCPEFDFLWLALFCRARKHVSPAEYDWGPIRRRLLTLSQYWLQLPIGGAAMDKSFPRASNPRSRSCPPRLKVFTGASSSYEEGIDFVAKVVKLLVTGLGTGSTVQLTQPDNTTFEVSEGTNDVLRFLSFVTPYFNPSNVGSWTFTLGAFLHYFAYELCCRVGAVAGVEALKESHPSVVEAVAKAQPGEAEADIPPHEIVLLLDTLLPLCQQAIYSKNGHVARAGEASMLYLVQIDPVRASPSFIDFAARALDVSAVNMSHQAPAALSTLTRLIQPSLRSDPTAWLVRLPDLLRLSLAGIDSNDQNKTIRTLILYRGLASWIPVGGGLDTWHILDANGKMDTDDKDGTIRIGTHLFDNIVKKRECPAYLAAVGRLAETSLLRQGVRDDLNEPEIQTVVLEEAASAMSDWAIEFLGRVFELLRASGEREKAGKTSSGVATRHSTADVHQARNFSRILGECLAQVFASMDDEVHELAVRSVVRFLEEETLPAAAKDASLLCQAVAGARRCGDGGSVSPGLDALIPVLTDDFQQHSTKTLIYRFRCLAGAVRVASHGVIKHRAAISAAIGYALSSDDRHLFKTGCKVLRHTLSTLTESYPLAADAGPRLFRGEEGSFPVLFGRSAQLQGDKVEWHVPDATCVQFAADLLSTHVALRLDNQCCDTGASRSKLLNSVDIQELRRCLRVVRYSIRGGASLLLDEEPPKDGLGHVPYEIASLRLIEKGGDTAKASLLQLRGRISSFLIVLSSIIASDTLYPDSIVDLSDENYRKTLPLISSDPKVCKETCDIALLLLTRRGACFRSQEAKTVLKAQKQVATDFSLSAQVDRILEVLQSAGLAEHKDVALYKDGEDAGKTVPRRLLVTRLHLFHNSLQRNASFEVPKRLRRFERDNKFRRNILFSMKPTLSETVTYLESMLVKTLENRPLDAYEGVVDGLFALCCHSNTQVRASAISVVDYAMTRFGWIVASRVPRILSGLALKDENMNGKFGVPSCALLIDKMNQQGKRKRLAEAIKGVCSIMSLSRSVRQVLASWSLRETFVRTVCGTDYLVSLLPAEEMQKIIHYLQAVFSPFRTSYYSLPLTSSADRQHKENCLSFVLDILSEKNGDSAEAESDTSEKKGAHWRKLLLASWFSLVFVDKSDIANDSATANRIWSTCFGVLENEMGQPLQRVSLGLFGEIISFIDHQEANTTALDAKMSTGAFCSSLGKALVYDHKEDTSVGGGHDAQWSSGVENIIRDASRHIAPRTLFPFQRTSQSLGSFKVSHSQLIEGILHTVNDSTRMPACEHLLATCKELVGAPPSEDQRNQQITSAEIFAGVCGSLIRTGQASTDVWTKHLLPFLDEAMSKTPFSLCGAFFDAIRYALQFSPSTSFHPLTLWLIEKVGSTLWQPNGAGETMSDDFVAPPGQNGSSHGTEGFTAQSKWLFLFSALIIEMDEMEYDDMVSRPPWFQNELAVEDPSQHEISMTTSDERERSWRLVTETLLPRLTDALGHPFDSCRDHISRCLFRICYSHRKMSRKSTSRSPSSGELSSGSNGQVDPGMAVVEKIALLDREHSWSYKDRYNALSTTRRFISYCVHLGEAKFEFADYVIPLLPLAFEALNASSEDEVPDGSHTKSQEESAARRALETEVINGYRNTLSEVSVTAVISYGGDTEITRVLLAVEAACRHPKWQVRHAAANFLRCFQGAHKFLFKSEHTAKTTDIVVSLLADERREVSSAAMAALTGILAASPSEEVSRLVKKYTKVASSSKMKKARKGSAKSVDPDPEKEKTRIRNQQVSVFALCATVMAQPYETPSYVPEALAAISKHSFEKNAPLGVRDIVKKCCAEYKRTHMSDNWEVHRSMFSQEQLEAFEDVVSTPHYYA